MKFPPRRLASCSFHCVLFSALASVFAPLPVFAQGVPTDGAPSALPTDKPSSNASGGYVPPQGEAIDYGKKYRPNVPKKDLVLELNPLLLARRSLSLEAEKQIGETISVGADFTYRHAQVYDAGGVEGHIEYLGIAPKIRLYPLATLGGFFFGGKLFIGSHTLSVSQGNLKSEKNVFTVAPAAHVGYRLTTFSGFTLAAYVGGGINIPKPELKTKDLDSRYSNDAKWQDAKDDVNRNDGLFQPDFGLTFGIAL